MVSMNQKHYVTPCGYKALQDELNELLKIERPKLVETVRWAAGNGDRSENGDYIYGKRRLREIDKRVRYLTKRIENSTVVDPSLQQHHTQVFFGATVKYVDEDGVEKTVKIVGIDEADISRNKISYTCPVAKALIKSKVGDVVLVKTLSSENELEVLSINYDSSS